jgi:hypothetical protein
MAWNFHSQLPSFGDPLSMQRDLLAVHDTCHEQAQLICRENPSDVDIIQHFTHVYQLYEHHGIVLPMSAHGYGCKEILTFLNPVQVIHS